MAFVYPNFAFTKHMQFLLFLFNIISVTIPCYWGTTLLLDVIQKQASFFRKLIFSLISSFFSYIFFTYTISFIYGIILGTGRLYLGNLYYAATTPSPILSIIFYFLALKILNLPPVKCVSLMQKVYILYTCSLLLIRAGNMLIPDFSYADPRGFNYLYVLFKLLFFLFPIYVIYRILRYFVKKLGYSIVYPDNITVDSIPKAILKNFFFCCAVYTIVICSLYYQDLDPIHPLLLTIIFLGYLLLSMVLDINRIQTTLIINQNEHLTELNNSIEEFRGIKHDFNNIIQTYGGYISIGAYDALKAYHNRMAGDVLIAENYMDFSKRLPENPSFFYLLIKKLDRAKELGIKFDARSICDIRDVFIDPFDFNRVIAVFLDNALEAATLTPQKKVSVSVQNKNSASKLFIISNDTQGDIDIDKIFNQKYTTKEGHMGQGLAQVRTILGKYNNSMLNFTFYKNTFTVYLELRPPDKK